MKNSFKKALKLFKYLSIFFTVIFWTYMIIDDYVLWKEYEYGINAEKIGFWIVWFVLYFLVFAFYYWITCSAVIFIYHKVRRKHIEN